mmetsp:Transcript_38990/g.70388  ORF Transcript_38990/g.70388 Transcript_38990/m.70388 type:complete len:235 (+) Transcript_38990:173-877(+)
MPVLSEAMHVLLLTSIVEEADLFTIDHIFILVWLLCIRHVLLEVSCLPLRQRTMQEFSNAVLLSNKFFDGLGINLADAMRILLKSIPDLGIECSSTKFAVALWDVFAILVVLPVGIRVHVWILIRASCSPRLVRIGDNFAIVARELLVSRLSIHLGHFWIWSELIAPGVVNVGAVPSNIETLWPAVASFVRMVSDAVVKVTSNSFRVTQRGWANSPGAYHHRAIFLRGQELALV